MLPFLLVALPASFAVFFVSALMNTLLTYHQSTYVALPSAAETALINVLREQSVSPNTYIYPAPKSMATAMEDKAWISKMSNGPIGSIRVDQGLNGPPSMNAQLLQFFIWICIVSSATLFVRSGQQENVNVATFLVALFGHCGGDISAMIWESKKKSNVFIHIFDSAVYAVITTAVFYLIA